MSVDPALLEGFAWRNIGPPRGGRVVAVAGDPVDRNVFYFGACAGGVWKTYDGGTYWENVSDGFFKTAAVGAIAVSDSDPNVVYAGMGESCVRNDVSHGDGVYRSTDGGASWTHLGLEATRHISRIRIHPTDPDTAYVAALGDIFGPNRERGIYRTRDGGTTWDHVLFHTERAGAADLWLDPSNPRVLFAALWQGERQQWSMESGGPDSALFRSTDGGDSWTDITRNPGLPKKALLGRMGICASPVRGERVWVLVEASDGESGLYRSDDRGEQWHRISEDKAILGRPWYYSHLVPDPLDADTIYSMNFQFWKSTDGGRTFQVMMTPHGDNHDLWIDPADSRRMIEGNDGGACVSFNGGETFSTIYNQPTGQIYHVATDDRFPYRVYGTQQDNSAICVPSRSRRGAIFWDDCYPVGHSESGWITVDPMNPDIVISGAVGSAGGGGGCMWKYDHATGQSQLVTVWPEVFYGQDMDAQQHRFQWTYPLLFSRHDPTVLFACGERVFRSTDHGQSWEAISDDLTRDDASKQKASGGPISKDTSGAEIYCTIFAFAESAHEPDTYWAGSDDGLVHVTRDAGEKWLDVTPPDLPEWAVVNALEASPHQSGTVYLSATSYKLQDRAPYLFKTTDFGATWARITDGIAPDDFTRIIRCDPEVAGLLYAGTETTAYVSFDDGSSWVSLAGKNLPAVPVYDLAIKDGDLVAATHGRGFWILDDLIAIRQLATGLIDGPATLVVPPRVVRYPTPPGTRVTAPGKNYFGGAAFRSRRHPDGSKDNLFYDAGHNPPDGVTIWFHLRDEAQADALEITFHDRDGAQLVSFTPDSDPPATPDEIEAEDSRSVEDLPVAAEGEEGEGGDVAGDTAEPSKAPAAGKRKKWWENVPRAAGLNSFTWDLRVSGAVSIPDKDGKTEPGTGFRVAPGTYEARLRVGEALITATFEVVADPRVRASQGDLDAQFELLGEIRDSVSAINAGIGRVRKVRAQATTWSERADAPDDVRAQAKEVLKGLATAEARLTQPKHTHDTDRLKLPPGLDTRVGALTDVVGSADAAPTAQARAVFAKLSAQVDEALRDLDQVVDDGVSSLNRAIAAADLAAIQT